jgi:hypothetical protein
MSSVVRRIVVCGPLACAWLFIGAAVAAPPVQQAGAQWDEALRTFDAAVAGYAARRATFEEPLPAFEDPRRDGWTLMLMRRYLASAIRTARREAEPGVIFAPAAGAFRDIIARAIYEVDIEGLVDIVPGEDGFTLDLALNEPIPAWALSPVPPPLLERLPSLPAAIEYRIATGALILWDTHAEILVDALPDAFVAP